MPNTLLVPAVAERLLALHEPARALRDKTARDFLADPATEVLGSGSNVLILESHLPQVAHIAATGWRALTAGAKVWITAEAGLLLDTLVRETARRGWYGLERLAEIPGTIGAAPMQNVGAYGAQLSDCVTGLTAWDRATGRIVWWPAAECGFAYRDSRFKQEAPRWLILSVDFLLSTTRPAEWPPLEYPGIAAAADAFCAEQSCLPAALTPLDVAQIITRVRRQKLPDWRSPPPGSAGSFFQNPIVPRHQAQALRARYPELPLYATECADQMKLSAGWLIEQCGWRGRRIGDAGIYDAHALVLVNHGRATGAALWALAQQIRAAVSSQFGVALTPEPRLIGRPG